LLLLIAKNGLRNLPPSKEENNLFYFGNLIKVFLIKVYTLERRKNGFWFTL